MVLVFAILTLSQLKYGWYSLREVLYRSLANSYMDGLVNGSNSHICSVKNAGLMHGVNHFHTIMKVRTALNHTTDSSRKSDSAQVGHTVSTSVANLA